MALQKIQNMPRRTKLAIFSVAVVFFILGIIAERFLPFPTAVTSVNTALPRTPVRLGTNGLVNPLLFISDGKTPSTQLQPLQDIIQAKVTQDEQAGYASDVGVYFHDLQSSQWTGVNKDDLFSPASLLKVPIMIAYLKIAETSPSALNDQLYYDGSFDDNQAENIKPLKEIEKGKTYTAGDLLGFMMDYSDNNAMDLLINHIGMNAINQVYSDLRVPTSSSTADYLTPQAYSRFFRVLYSATYLDSTMSEQALELLTYPDFPQGIRSGVPEDVVVADKFGERSFSDQNNPSNELHDCGIVYHPANPYFLCVMTKGSNFIGLENVLHDVSQVVWQAVDKDNY